GYSTTTRFPTIRPDLQYFEVGDIRGSIGEGPNSFVASRGPVVSDSCNSYDFVKTLTSSTPSELRARYDSRDLDQDSHEFTPSEFRAR
ncbi:hypothetical protein DPMN_116586, partial [Dreissena polymorpha]